MEFLDKVLAFLDKLVDWATYGFKVISAITKGIRATRDNWPKWPGNPGDVFQKKEDTTGGNKESTGGLRSAGKNDTILDNGVSVRNDILDIEGIKAVK